MATGLPARMRMRAHLQSEAIRIIRRSHHGAECHDIHDIGQAHLIHDIGQAHFGGVPLLENQSGQASPGTRTNVSSTIRSTLALRPSQPNTAVERQGPVRPMRAAESGPGRRTTPTIRRIETRFSRHAFRPTREQRPSAHDCACRRPFIVETKWTSRTSNPGPMIARRRAHTTVVSPILMHDFAAGGRTPGRRRVQRCHASAARHLNVATIR